MDHSTNPLKYSYLMDCLHIEGKYSSSLLSMSGLKLSQPQFSTILLELTL